jgi:hypothetical protein
VPNSVIVGKLRAVDGDAIVIGGGIRLIPMPGVDAKGIPLETSVTVVAAERDGRLYGESIRVTPDYLFSSLRRVNPPSP